MSNIIDVKNIVEKTMGVKINAKSRVRQNSIARKIFVYICVNELNTPYFKLAQMTGKSESLMRVYNHFFCDIKYDKVLDKYYNECLNKYNDSRRLSVQLHLLSRA